jgi:aspartate racemase
VDGKLDPILSHQARGPCRYPNSAYSFSSECPRPAPKDAARWTHLEKNMRRIGLIAGLHTEATVLYLRQFDEQITERFGPADPIGVFVNSTNGRAFENAMKRKDSAQAQRLCVEAAQQCAAAGADALLLGNSQLHVSAEAIQSSVRIPLLHMVDAALSVAANTGIRRIALLGVRFPDEDAIWQESCEDHGLIAAVPPADAAARVSAIVKEELSRGFVDGASKAELVRLCSDFRRDGARAVVLAAPELPTANENSDRLHSAQSRPNQ